MSISQEQSLDEDVIILPMSASSPDCHHCEGERYALEALLSSGPKAFYRRQQDERLIPFLSQEEVNLISDWVQDYQISHVQLDEMKGAEDGCSSRMQDFSTSYFPTQSETPAPCLELGWPEKVTWMGMGKVTVHTSPHAGGQPPIREIIRRLLQGATKVIAMVTDRLTDCAVIGDLHTMASQGVPVYVILNRRSIQETMNHNRLRHPNIRVRVLGGNNFFSREGKMVMGEMKNNFLLVDLETVVNGSYSFTWSDAHLHRQLVTVLTGPVVEMFDTEFRILFAASHPVPDNLKTGTAPIDAPLSHSESLNIDKRPNCLPIEAIEIPPLHPPSDLPIDWVALGFVGSLVNQYKEPRDMNMDTEESLQNFTAVDNKPSFREELGPTEFKHRITTPLDEGRVQYKTYARHLPKGDVNVSVRNCGNEMETGPKEEAEALSSTQRRDRPARREDITVDFLSEEDNSVDSSMVNCPSTFRRHLTLNMPQSESISSLSDIMRRLQPSQTYSAKLREASKTTMSDHSRSMMDLRRMDRDPNFQEKEPSVPQASCFDTFRMTPALALMRNRSDELKMGIFRPPKTFMPPTTRPRSSSFGLLRSWRKPQTDLDRGREEGN